MAFQKGFEQLLNMTAVLVERNVPNAEPAQVHHHPVSTGTEKPAVDFQKDVLVSDSL